MRFRVPLLVVCTWVLLLSACASSAEWQESSPAPAATVAPVAAETPLPTSTETTTTTAPESTASTTSDSESAQAADSATLPTCRGDSASAARQSGRTDVDSSGNRRAPGGIDLLNVPMTTVELPASPLWVVRSFEPDDECLPHWHVALDDGSAVVVDASGAITAASNTATPPETSASGVASANAGLENFENPLPDSRVVTFEQWTAALVDPTDRYGHGVLGDRIEAGGVEVLDRETGERTRITIEPPSVIEGISPMLLDVDNTDEGVPEILVTLSNGDDGAWLALYNIDGTLRAESEPIGRGNRWRNQLGGGNTTLDGTFEIVDVRTPHLDGVVEYFRVVGDRLERVTSTSGYTSHVLGSRNLDQGILVDADQDKLLEVVLPTRDLQSLAVIDRSGDQAVELGRIDLGGSLSTNIATQWIIGQAWIALGTRDGRLLIFGDPG